jgi:hypothetical protein
MKGSEISMRALLHEKPLRSTLHWQLIPFVQKAIKAAKHLAHETFIHPMHQPYACPAKLYPKRQYLPENEPRRIEDFPFPTEPHHKFLSYHPHWPLPPSGSIRLRLLSTSCIGKSLVPTASLAFRSLSSNRIALIAKILSAARPAVSWYCCSLWTPSANWSTLNSRFDCTDRRRSTISFLSSRAGAEDINKRIAACSGSSRDGSICEASRSADSSEIIGGRVGGGLARDFH